MKHQKGLFGQTVHYSDTGEFLGETWDGLLEGSKVHTDSNGFYAGRSEKGIFSEEAHFNDRSEFLGTTGKGLLFDKTHRSFQGSLAGVSYGNRTDLFEKPSSSSIFKSSRDDLFSDSNDNEDDYME